MSACRRGKGGPVGGVLGMREELREGVFLLCAGTFFTECRHWCSTVGPSFDIDAEQFKSREVHDLCKTSRTPPEIRKCGSDLWRTKLGIPAAGVPF